LVRVLAASPMLLVRLLRLWLFERLVRKRLWLLEWLWLLQQLLLNV
jgi:hypothetical protein